MQQLYYISSSFCPHYKCGTWGYIEASSSEVATGLLEQGYTSYYCEVTALLMVLKRAISTGADDVTIYTRNQSLWTRFDREWEHMWQINYARKPPWDQIPQLLREMPKRPNLLWNTSTSCLNSDFIRCEVAGQLALCRTNLVERISDKLNSVN